MRTTNTFALLTLALLFTGLDAESLPAAASKLSAETPRQILRMDLPFEVEYNPSVEKQLEGYLVYGRRETRQMLARTASYFPIFEHYLRKHGLPDELKFIPLLESRLRPQAESPAGAAGLWQFMPIAAEHYRLNINDYVDERLNPFRATEAAVKMLRDLYHEFDDWALALAAYNCGPGRVRKALRLSGCDTFWDIQHLLPRQTQRYLPGLIATIYIGRHYEAHGLAPSSNARSPQSFRVFRVNGALSLGDIATHCQLSLAEILALNPGYQQDFVPAQARGHYLILPETACGKFQQYILKESRRGNGNYAVAVLQSNQSSRTAAAL
jgi:membrane-bound lytic murein transglycosylase D